MVHTDPGNMRVIAFSVHNLCELCAFAVSPLYN